MKKLLIKFIALSIGITLGIYASWKINILNEVVGDLGLGTGTSIKSSETSENNEYADNLVLINGEYDHFIIDLKYATKNNVTKEVLYEKELAYLQKNTLAKLIKANEELRAIGYRLKIWDAYRPLYVQKKLWAAYPNANYIANPFANGSNHNRGTAVDVTLVDSSGKELEMPTGFDGFGPESRRGYKWSDEATKNVKILTDVMIKYGFTSINSEWWHFDDEDSAEYSIMDFKFRDLLKK